MESTELEFDKSLKDKPIKIFFQDEGRFGRINSLHRCWSPINNRAVVCKQLIRQYVYAYTAVCPKTGETFSLILPYANSEAMKIFLNEMSKAYPENRIIMIMDNASWHNNYSIKEVRNIKPLFLPARALELNPVECIWQHIKENHFSNRVFESIEKVIEKLVDVLQKLNNNMERSIIKKMTYFNWLSTL